MGAANARARRGPGAAAAVALSVALALGGCTSTSEPEESASPTGSATASQTPSPSATAIPLLDSAQAAATALRDEDYEALALLVDQAEGLRFSPYAFVDLDNDVVIPADQVGDLGDDPTVRVWGTQAGSGDPIEGTFADYRADYVWDQDFLAAPEISQNVPIGTGNSLNNLTEAYPGDSFVEYHFPGFDPANEGFDWVSLRLVLKPAEGGWALVGIVHDEWTP